MTLADWLPFPCCLGLLVMLFLVVPAVLGAGRGTRLEQESDEPIQ